MSLVDSIIVTITNVLLLPERCCMWVCGCVYICIHPVYCVQLLDVLYSVRTRGVWDGMRLDSYITPDPLRVLERDGDFQPPSSMYSEMWIVGHVCAVMARGGYLRVLLTWYDGL